MFSISQILLLIGSLLVMGLAAFVYLAKNKGVIWKLTAYPLFIVFIISVILFFIYYIRFIFEFGYNALYLIITIAFILAVSSIPAVIQSNLMHYFKTKKVTPKPPGKKSTK